MRYHPLGKTGLTVSILGFGASPLGDEFGPADPDEGVRAVHAAIDAGINFFDTSPFYGRTLSEERLGVALQGKRHSVILATKCGRYGKEEFDFSASRIRRSIDESLARLRTDYVDVLQAHDIEFGEARQIVEETIPAMREIQRSGRARFIGITGLQLHMLRSVAEAAAVDTLLSYCRYNLLVVDRDELLTPFARTHSLGLINASPLHMGVLTGQGPPAWHPAAQEVLQAGREATAICRSHGADIAEIALQFCLASPDSATTLTGMSTRDQVEANVRAASGVSDPALLRELEQALIPVRNRIWPCGRAENSDAAVAI